MSQVIRIATRASRLALWQSESVARMLTEQLGVEVELVKRETQGDKTTGPLWREGGKALFVSALERMLFDGDADIAVHSMKDVPTTLTPGMTIATILPRADTADAFVSRHYQSLDELPPDARVGTCSLRRQSQIKHRRSDIQCINLRGNVETRLAKLDEGQFDAIVLACAGLSRLGYADRITARLSDDEMLPAIAQGAIGIECRADDTRMLEMAMKFDDEASRARVEVERAFGCALGADCHSAVAALATSAEGGSRMTLRTMVASPDGQTVLRSEDESVDSEIASLGQTAADKLIAQGARELLAMTPEE